MRGGSHIGSRSGRGWSRQSGTQIGGERGDEVVNGRCKRSTPSPFGEGLYTLRLTVNRPEGPRQGGQHPVTIDNTPPSVVLSEPVADRLYVMEDDEQININAIVNDTWAVGRVEFFMDGQRIVVGSTVSPYNERWKITMRDQALVDGGVAWPAFVSDDPEVQPGTILEYGDGFAAARTAGGVNLEGHTIKVIGLRRAGNGGQQGRERRSARVCVRHKKDE